MAHPSMAARLRALHHERPFLLFNAWTVGSALRLERLGFAAVGTTSAGLALDAGVADGEAGRGRTLAVAGAIAAALAIPVSADLENGFDDKAEGCAATVLDSMARGVAGGSIEDATGRPDDPIYPLDHAVSRIRAVAQAIRGSGGDFVLTARSENFLHGRPDLQDTIARLKAFEEAGADGVGPDRGGPCRCRRRAHQPRQRPRPRRRPCRNGPRPVRAGGPFGSQSQEISHGSSARL